MSMNPNCDSCCGEDAEHCLCAECMKESAEADRVAGINEGWTMAVEAIEAWLRKTSDDPVLAHADAAESLVDAADALQVAERWRKPPEKRSKA